MTIFQGLTGWFRNLFSHTPAAPKSESTTTITVDRHRADIQRINRFGEPWIPRRRRQPSPYEWRRFESVEELRHIGYRAARRPKEGFE